MYKPNLPKTPRLPWDAWARGKFWKYIVRWNLGRFYIEIVKEVKV